MGSFICWLPRLSLPYIPAMQSQDPQNAFQQQLHRFTFFTACLLLLTACQKNTPAQLLSGPMPAYSTQREVAVWLEAEHSHHASLTYHPAGHPEAAVTLELPAPQPSPAGGEIYCFHPTLLQPGTVYEYSIRLDGKPLAFDKTDKPLTFKTQADWEFHAPPPDFSFITGSCLYLNDPPYDRPGKPYGQGDAILSHMAASGADFMLWLGDNLYLRPAEYTSPGGIWYRYQHDRSNPELQPLLRTMHHYAIWDDHDYGPNDSSRSYPLKETTLAAFKAHWPATSYGEPDNPGIYSSMTWSDCAFFLMDDRYYRDEQGLNPQEYPEKSVFGRKQLEWLKQSLLCHREATFKFIVIGGQFLHDNTFETFSAYPHDRKELLDFIERYKISGVIFLTGDRHYTELTKMERGKASYPVYDLTCSPLGSGVARAVLTDVNPQRVEHTVVPTQNFCKLSVTGPAKERTLKMTCIDKTGKQCWERSIKASEISYPSVSVP